MKRGHISFASLLIATAAVFFFIIAIAVGALVSDRYSKTMWNRQMDTMVSSLSVSASQISQVLNNAKVAAAAARNNADIDEYLYGNFSSPRERVFARRDALSATQNAVNNTPALSGLLFIRSDGTLSGCFSGWTFANEDGAHPLAGDEKLARAGFSPGVTWLAPYQLADLTQSAATKISKENVLILGAIKERYVLSYDMQEHVLVTLAAVSAKELGACFDYLCTEDDRVYLAGEGGECILSAGGEWRRGPVSCFVCVNRESVSGCERWSPEDGAERYVAYHRIPSTGWYLIQTTSARMFQRDLEALRMSVIWIALGLLFVTILFYTLWSKQATQSLDRLNDAMERMREGDLALRIEKPMRIREYETIRGQFNRMADRIERLLQETRQMERDRAALEARALQTQLSPHMIFNSISAIRWIATVMGVEQISGMLGALAELLRPVFKQWSLTWRLREEIAHLDSYVVLLKLRYGDALSLNMDIPEALLDLAIPCFVLQPILENCFEHSRRKADALRVSICAYRDDDGALMILVEDNGGGIEPEALDKLRQKMAQTEEEAAGSRGIGLYNVHRKLQLLCTKRSGLRLESGGEGTRVILRIFTDVKK